MLGDSKDVSRPEKSENALLSFFKCHPRIALHSKGQECGASFDFEHASSYDCIAEVLEDLAAHDRTLSVLENHDAIYAPTEPERQETTDGLLPLLASIDDVALTILLGGVTLPGSGTWDRVLKMRPRSARCSLRQAQHSQRRLHQNSFETP